MVPDPHMDPNMTQEADEVWTSLEAFEPSRWGLDFQNDSVWCCDSVQPRPWTPYNRTVEDTACPFTRYHRLHICSCLAACWCYCLFRQFHLCQWHTIRVTYHACCVNANPSSAMANRSLASSRAPLLPSIQHWMMLWNAACTHNSSASSQHYNLHKAVFVMASSAKSSCCWVERGMKAGQMLDTHCCNLLNHRAPLSPAATQHEW